MKKPDIHRLLAFEEFLLRFRTIERMIPLPFSSQENENDAEHSYALAMTAWFLAPYFPRLDCNLVIRMALVHDLIELHAGDTFAYDSGERKATKSESEAVAMARIKRDWPDFSDMAEAIRTYEACESAEARFVYALDKFIPPIVNYLNEGKGWKVHGITIDELHREKQSKIARSPEVYEYYQQLYDLLQQKPHLFPTASHQR